MPKCSPFYHLNLFTRGEDKKRSSDQKPSIFCETCTDLQKFGQLLIVFQTCPLFEQLVALIISFAETCPPFL